MAADPNKQPVTALPPFAGVILRMTPLTVTAELEPICQPVAGVPLPPYYLPQRGPELFQYFGPLFFAGCSRLITGQWVASIDGVASISYSDTWNGPFTADPTGTYIAPASCTQPMTIEIERV